MRRSSYSLAMVLALGACGDDASELDDPLMDAGFGGHTLDAELPPLPGPGAFGGDAGADAGPVYDWRLPKNFPLPAVPADNPMTAEKVELGRFLFYDERLSVDDTFSCATCHKQELAFTDGRATGLGVTGQAHSRSSMSLANLAYTPTLTWANPLMTELERQARVPLFGDAPIEMGLGGVRELEDKLAQIPGYRPLFERAFPEQPQVDTPNVLKALAAFERTLISGDSPFDRWQAGDEGALSDAAKRGHQLFNSERLECFHCHSGFALTDHVTWQGKAFPEAPFHQTGLYDLDGRGGYPVPNTGVHDTSGQARDMGKFKAPTLRNIALTAPYMHDGSIATLPEVLEHYGKGGRAHSFRTDPLLVGFELSQQERDDVIAFLESLTDPTFLTDPRFADPGTIE